MQPIRIKACSESDLRMLGNLARNIQRVLPVTQADIDAAAALGKEWVVWKVIEVNDPLDNLRGGTQLVIKQNSITAGQNVRRVLLMGPSGQIVIVNGHDYIVLPDAIADSLQYVKAFGGTELVPETYLDTVTAEGKCEQRNVPSEYVENMFVYMLDGSYLLTDIVPTYDCKIEMDFATASVPSASVTFFGGRSGDSVGNGLQLAKPANGNFIVDAFNGTRYVSNVTPASNTRYKFTFNNQVVTLESAGSTLFTNTFTGTGATGDAIAINALNTNDVITGNNAGIYLYSFKVWNAQGELIADYVPATLLNPLTVGIYDRVTGTHLLPTSGTWSAGPALQAPTPDRPIDIVCNNGVLKARHQSGLPLGYILLDYIESTGTQYIDTDYTGSATTQVNIDFQLTETAYTILFGTGGADVTSGSNISNYFFANPSGQSWGAYVNGSYTYTGTNTDLNRHKVRYNDGNNYYFDDTLFISNRQPSFNKKIYLFASNGDSAVRPTKAKMYSVQIYNNGTPVRDFVPAKRNSDNVIGMYDTVSGTFFTNQGTGDFTAGSAVSDPVEIYTDGTVETITDADSNTATCEMLLSAGIYEDTQEVISGAITRNVGIKVLDGTEEWIQMHNDNTDTFTTRISDMKVGIDQDGLCTHFTKGKPPIPSGAAYVQFGAGSNYVYFRWLFGESPYQTVAQWKQYLADQYNAGTPVIVIYPLATATTESVAGQFLDHAPVTATGSISSLVVNAVSSSHSTPTPVHPLEINCNNGVLKVDTYGLPSGYTKLEYIESTGTQYIDTGIRVNTNSKVDITFSDLTAGWIIGAVNSPGAANDFGVSSSAIRFGTQYATGLSFPTKTDVQFDKDGYAINGTSTSWGSTAYLAGDKNVYLFWANGSSASKAGKIYSCKIWDNDTLVRDFIPCKNASNVVGMFDTVSQTFFTNAGTGDFVAGPAVGTTVYTDGTVETLWMHGKNLFDISTVTVGECLNDSGTVEPDANAMLSDYILVKPNTQYVLRFVRTASGVYTRLCTFDANKGFVNLHKNQTTSAGGITINLTTGNDVKYIRFSIKKDSTEVQLEQGSTATEYEPYYNGGTAVAEMLLKVGGYQDVQSILDGVVTRRVGIKVLDGTEDWYKTGDYLYNNTILPSETGDSDAICTHFYSGSKFSSMVALPDHSIRAGGAGYLRSIYVKDSVLCASAAIFKQFLADQYNAGTPVIIVYPLATETTESVAGQTMQVQAGDNYLEITQASMSGLELEAKYEAGVVLTVQEVEDANLDPNVEVTII